MNDSINYVKTSRMIILGSWLGWALDGYDLVLMLFVISSVSQLFFPAEDQKLSLLATFSTGLLPTWQIVGILAPVLLIILRFSQGLFAGGEWGSGAVISMESVPKSSRGIISGFIQSGFPFGFLIASVTYWIVSSLYQNEIGRASCRERV